MPFVQMRLVYVAAALCLATVAIAGTDRPIIGVLTVGPTSSSCPTLRTRGDEEPILRDTKGCFSAFYVKWLEAAGARVVPIFYTSPKHELDLIFEGVNGILFTGGGLDLLPNETYTKTGTYLFNKVLEANDRGEHVPLFGTCMGMQFMSNLAAGDDVLDHYAYDSQDVSWPLELTEAAHRSRMLGPSAPADLIKIFATENVTLNWHHDGVSTTTFNTNKKLNSFFDMLSWNFDKKGKPFVSTIEAKKYPIFGTQWHAERAQFQFTPNVGINHEVNSVRAMQYVANFFVNEARKNNHKFPTVADEEARLIYNYPAQYIGNGRQIYWFN